MATPDLKSEDWFEEFKKLNTPGSASPESSGPDPASTSKGSERRRHARFEIDAAGRLTLLSEEKP